jgi:hypothetical protein
LGKKTEIFKKEKIEYFVKYCIEICDVCSEKMIYIGNEDLCPKCTSKLTLDKKIFFEALNCIITTAKEEINSELEKSDLDKLISMVFTNRMKNVNSFLSFMDRHDSTYKLNAPEWLYQQYILNILFSKPPNKILINSNPPESKYQKLIKLAEVVIESIEWSEEVENEFKIPIKSSEANEFIEKMCSGILEENTGFILNDRPIIKRLNRIYNYFGIYFSTMTPNDKYGFSELLIKYDIEPFQNENHTGVLLDLAPFITGLTPSIIKSRQLNFKVLTQIGITGKMLFDFFNNSITYIKSRGNAIGAFLALTELYELAKNSGFNFEQFACIVSFPPNVDLTAKENKNKFLKAEFPDQEFNEGLNSIPICLFINETYFDNGTRVINKVLIDPVTILIYSFLISRFSSSEWKKKQDYEGNLMETELIKKIFVSKECDYLISSEIEEIAKKNSLSGKTKRGEIDGLAILKNQKIAYIVESKFLRFPSTQWANKEQLGISTMHIIGIIDGFDVTFKVDEDYKITYFKESKNYNLETKLNWIKTNWKCFSNIPVNEVSFKKLIITNIPPPINPISIPDVNIISIIDLENYLDFG